jgi:hypothetical protein
MTAFSCTCHPNMKEAKPHCAIERRNVLYVGFCHSSVKSVYSSRGVNQQLERLPVRKREDRTTCVRPVRMKHPTGLISGKMAKFVSPTRPREVEAIPVADIFRKVRRVDTGCARQDPY